MSNSASRVAYSLAAGAAAATAAATEGAIVYSNAQNISINQYGSLNLDLNLDGQGDVTLKNYVFSGGNYQGATVNYSPGKLMTFSANGFAYVKSLAFGAAINAAQINSSTFFGSMAYGPTNPNAQFNNASGAYLGLRFAAGANTYYGWVRVSIDNAAGTFVVNDWAYNDTNNAGITAGAVPGPGTLALLAAGPLGLGTLRGRRKQKA
ncbi:MAG: hypothetical protein FJX31_01150 [Alphaproteobacteria bacterium]|nr:hypothetical protein [Alphaproteobacteria bacterium]